MARDVIIDVQQLSVRYGGSTAVDRLDLQLYRGELFGLLGPNGAGKSSTMRVLIGQRRATSGTVRVHGFDVARQWDRVKPLFGYVPDRDNHFDEFTGRRNLSIFAGLYQVPRERIDACLGVVELQEAADHVVRGYSMGMRKKLMLARALLHDPPVLYLDEPTANLDIHSAEVVHRILRQRVGQGKTVVLTTHNMQEVEAICDRVGIMCRGKLIALDAPLTLRQAHTERKIDVTLTSGERLVIDLESERERTELSTLMQQGRVGSCHTREFDFHSTFLKLTGTEFS